MAAEPEIRAVLAGLEDFDRTVAQLCAANVVLATPVLLRRLDELEAAARSVGDPVAIAIGERLRRQLVNGRGLDG